jgi:hypothetical protein
VKLVCGDDVLAPDCLEAQVTAFDTGGPGVVMVAARRDVIDAAGQPVVRRRGLAGLRGRVAGALAVRSTVRAGTNIFGEPCCVLMCARTLQDIGGWHGTDGYVIDLATYVRLLMLGDVICLPRSLAEFRVSAGQWSVALARVQTRQNLALHRDVSVLAPHLLGRADRLPRAVAPHDGRRGAAAPRAGAGGHGSHHSRLTKTVGALWNCRRRQDDFPTEDP